MRDAIGARLGENPRGRDWGALSGPALRAPHPVALDLATAEAMERVVRHVPTVTEGEGGPATIAL